MPIPVESLDVDTAGGLPDRLLRPLVLSRRTNVVDESDGSVSAIWSSAEFLGRFVRGSANESSDDGRQATVTGWKLMTNYGGLRAGDRIIDLDEDREGLTGDDYPWEVAGHPIPMREQSAIHHYEVPLRRVEG